MALFSHLLTQTAADELDDIGDHKPPLFQDFFTMGRTANTDPNADLVLWRADKNPPKIHIHIVSGHANFITYLKTTAATYKIEENAKQKIPTIQELINAAGRQYASEGSTKKAYAKRLANIQKMTRTNGSAEWNDEHMEEGMFISCPERADIAAKLMAKYPVNGDTNDFPIEHFETLLKEDQYQGPYVIVEKEKSLAFLQALTATVRTGQDYSTEWAALEIPQKSYFQQAREFFLD